MPRFMLDTDTCSYIMKRSHPLVLKRLQAVPVGDVCMSVITKAELLYGVEFSPRRAQDAAALAAFLPYVDALDLDDDAAIHYAEIRADLKKRGALIGANDLFIARTRGRGSDAGHKQHRRVRARYRPEARQLDVSGPFAAALTRVWRPLYQYWPPRHPPAPLLFGSPESPKNLSSLGCSAI